MSRRQNRVVTSVQVVFFRGGGGVSSSVRMINYAGASWPASSAGK